jgi:hypothetical protein
MAIALAAFHLSRYVRSEAGKAAEVRPGSATLTKRKRGRLKSHDLYLRLCELRHLERLRRLQSASRLLESYG